MLSSGCIEFLKNPGAAAELAATQQQLSSNSYWLRNLKIGSVSKRRLPLTWTLVCTGLASRPRVVTGCGKRALTLRVVTPWGPVNDYRMFGGMSIPLQSWWIAKHPTSSGCVYCLLLTGCSVELLFNLGVGGNPFVLNVCKLRSDYATWRHIPEDSNLG